MSFAAKGRRKSIMFDFMVEILSRSEVKNGFVIVCFFANMSSIVLRMVSKGSVMEDGLVCAADVD